MRRLQIALLALVCGLVLAAPAETNTRLLGKITNHSSPADVERHFADGKQFRTFPASMLGLRDGTCYGYTNHSSWVAIECFGAVRP